MKSQSLLFFSSCRAELKCISCFKKHSKNTVNSLRCSVTAGDCRSLMASPKGELLSRAAGQLKQNHVWTPISTGMEEGGGALLALISLKTGKPLIKTLLLTFIFFLQRSRWLMSSTLIPVFRSAVPDISPPLITQRSGCDVENKIKKRTTPKPWPPPSLL